MKPNDLLQAMSEIRPEYIEAAAKFAVPPMQIRPKRTRSQLNPRTFAAISAGAAATAIACGVGVHLMKGRQLPPVDPDSAVTVTETDSGTETTPELTTVLTETTEPEKTSRSRKTTETTVKTEKTKNSSTTTSTTEKTTQKKAEVTFKTLTTASTRATEKTTSSKTQTTVSETASSLKTPETTKRTEQTNPVVTSRITTVFVPVSTTYSVPTVTLHPVTMLTVSEPTQTAPPPVTRDTVPPPPVTRETAPPPPVTRETAPPPPVTRETVPPPPVTRETAPPPVTRETLPQTKPHPVITETAPHTRPQPHTLPTVPQTTATELQTTVTETQTTATTSTTQTTPPPQTTVSRTEAGPGTVTTLWIPAHMAEKKELYNVTALITLPPPWMSGQTFTTALTDVPVIPYRKTVAGTLYPGALEDSVLCEVITDKTQIKTLLKDAEQMEQNVKPAETEKQINANPRLIRIRWQCSDTADRQYGVGTAVMDTAGMLNLMVPVYTDPDSAVQKEPCICELYLLADDSTLPELRSLNLSVGICKSGQSLLGLFKSDALSTYNRYLSTDACIRLRSTHY